MHHGMSDFQIPLKARYALCEPYAELSDVGWIHVFIEPFEFNDEVHDTCVRLYDVQGLDARLSGTASRVLKFPCHTTGDDIDGSLYLCGRHHTVDVPELVFGLHGGHAVPLTVLGTLTLTGWPEVPPVALELMTQVVLPLTQQEIEGRVDQAIRMTGATSLKQLGKVMAHIRPTLNYDSEPALVAAQAAKILSG